MTVICWDEARARPRPPRDALRDDAETLAQLTRIAMWAEQLVEAAQGHAIPAAVVRMDATRIAKTATEVRKALVARHREVGRDG